jgi:hypothetical protein
LEREQTTDTETHQENIARIQVRTRKNQNLGGASENEVKKYFKLYFDKFTSYSEMRVADVFRLRQW